MKNYYKILNISQDATKDEVKKSFRALAKKYHPDRNKDDENAIKMFQEVNEAYEVLGNEESREKYDKKLAEYSNSKSSSTKNNEKNSKTNMNNMNNTNNTRSKEDCMNDLNSYFSSFFGFDANTNNINKEKLKKQKNPIDTSSMFNSFFKVNKK